MTDNAEKALFVMYREVGAEMRGMLENRDYLGALHDMLKMKQPVDTFFDDVMVMAEDVQVRQNRLNPLTAIGDLILQIGDISKIQEAA